jgi:hypothetical protein
MTVDRYGDTQAKIPADVLRPIPAQDKRGFLVRLLDSIKVKVRMKGAKPDGVQVTGGAEF